MKQLIIIDEVYYKVLIGVLSAFIVYNLYASIVSGSLLGILPVLIQSVLIYLLVTKNLISQNIIKVWIIIFFFGIQCIKIILIVIQAIVKNMRGEENAIEMLSSDKILYSFAFIILGIIIWNLNKGFGDIIDSSTTEKH